MFGWKARLARSVESVWFTFWTAGSGASANAVSVWRWSREQGSAQEQRSTRVSPALIHCTYPSNVWSPLTVVGAPLGTVGKKPQTVKKNSLCHHANSAQHDRRSTSNRIVRHRGDHRERRAIRRDEPPLRTRTSTVDSEPGGSGA